MYVDEKKLGEVSEPVIDEIGRILLDAANLLEERGWGQGTISRQGKVCLFGVINLASGCRVPENSFDIIESNFKYKLARERIAKFSGKHHFNLIAWNDASGRTKEEVVNLLRKAAVNG